MQKSTFKTKSKGKGEFFIVGSVEEINRLAQSQKRYVGEKYDIDGAIASICVEDVNNLSLYVEWAISLITNNPLDL